MTEDDGTRVTRAGRKRQLPERGPYTEHVEPLSEMYDDEIISCTPAVVSVAVVIICGMAATSENT